VGNGGGIFICDDDGGESGIATRLSAGRGGGINKLAPLDIVVGVEIGRLGVVTAGEGEAVGVMVAGVNTGTTI
jgi:hypothetical protein